MNITSDVKDAKLTATVTIPAADVDAISKKGYKAAAKQYRVPGFRAGPAPRPGIESALGKDAVLAQAPNELIGSNEGNVLNELDIVPGKEGDYQESDLGAAGTDYTYTVEFTLRPSEEASVEVTVKGVKERKLPELNDEFAKTNFGFDGVDAMRDAVKLEIESDKSSQLPQLKENRCVAKLAERLQLDEMDEDYENSVFQEIGQNFLQSLSARGMSLDGWLQANRISSEDFIADLHRQANDVARESLARARPELPAEPFRPRHEPRRLAAGQPHQLRGLHRRPAPSGQRRRP